MRWTGGTTPPETWEHPPVREERPRWYVTVTPLGNGAHVERDLRAEWKGVDLGTKFVREVGRMDARAPREVRRGLRDVSITAALRRVSSARPLRGRAPLTSRPEDQWSREFCWQPPRRTTPTGTTRCTRQPGARNRSGLDTRAHHRRCGRDRRHRVDLRARRRRLLAVAHSRRAQGDGETRSHMKEAT